MICASIRDRCLELALGSRCQLSYHWGSASFVGDNSVKLESCTVLASVLEQVVPVLPDGQLVPLQNT